MAQLHAKAAAHMPAQTLLRLLLVLQVMQMHVLISATLVLLIK